jgi:integrase
MSSGHIRRRGERSWELKFDVGVDPVTGRRRIRYASVKGTKTDAKAGLVRLLHTVNAGTFVDPSKDTLADFLDRWDRDWASASNTSPSTLQRYRGLIANNIKPRLGAAPIQKLRPVQLNELYAALLREDQLAARTVGHVHRLLHRALGHAVTWGVIQQNPASAVKPPRVEDSEVEILKAGEVGSLLDRLHGRSLYPVAMFGLASGARRGEILALRWSDIDFTTGKVKIERSLEQTKAGGLRFKTTKTRRGKRTITVAPSVIAMLRAHRKAQRNGGWRWAPASCATMPWCSPPGTASSGRRMHCPRTGRRRWPPSA